jgi:hypothetical protein
MPALRVALNTAVLLGVFIFIVSSLPNHQWSTAQLNARSLAAVAAPLPLDAVDTANVDVSKLQNGVPAVKKFCVLDADQNGLCIPAKGELTYYGPTGAKLTCTWDIANPKLNSCINSLDVRSAIARGGARFTPEGMTLSFPLPASYGNPDILDAFSDTLPENKPYEVKDANTLPTENLAPQKAMLIGGSPTSLRPDATANNRANVTDSPENRSQAIFDEQHPEITLATSRTSSQPAMPADAKQSDIVEFLKDKNSLIPADNTNEWLDKVWPKDVPVLFLMEQHYDKNPKTELVKMLDLGEITDLVWEYDNWESGQKLVKDYMNGSVSRETLLKHYGCVNVSSPLCNIEVLDILDKAKEKGVRVWPLELAFPWESVSVESLKRRNLEWAKSIQNALKNDPNARVVIFGGMGHTGYVENGSTANQLLAESGIASVVIAVAEESIQTSRDTFPWKMPGGDVASILITALTNDVLDAVESGGLIKEKFLLPIGPGKNGMYPADYILYIPNKSKYPDCYTFLLWKFWCR